MGLVYGWESCHFGKRANSHRVFICEDVITAARLICADYPAMAVEGDGIWEEGFNTYLYSGAKTEAWLLADSIEWCQQVRDNAFYMGVPHLTAKFCIVPNRNKTDIHEIVKQCWELHGDKAPRTPPPPPEESGIRIVKQSPNHKLSRFDIRGAL